MAQVLLESSVTAAPFLGLSEVENHFIYTSFILMLARVSLASCLTLIAIMEELAGGLPVESDDEFMYQSVEPFVPPTFSPVLGDEGAIQWLASRFRRLEDDLRISHLDGNRVVDVANPNSGEPSLASSSSSSIPSPMIGIPTAHVYCIQSTITELEYAVASIIGFVRIILGGASEAMQNIRIACYDFQRCLGACDCLKARTTAVSTYIKADRTHFDRDPHILTQVKSEIISLIDTLGANVHELEKGLILGSINIKNLGNAVASFSHGLAEILREDLDNFLTICQFLRESVTEQVEERLWPQKNSMMVCRERQKRLATRVINLDFSGDLKKYFDEFIRLDDIIMKRLDQFRKTLDKLNASQTLLTIDPMYDLEDIRETYDQIQARTRIQLHGISSGVHSVDREFFGEEAASPQVTYSSRSESQAF